MAIMGRHVFDSGYDVRDHAAPLLQTNRLKTTKRNDVRTYCFLDQCESTSACLRKIASRMCDLVMNPCKRCRARDHQG